MIQLAIYLHEHYLYIPSRGRGSQKISAAPLSISDADALLKDKEINWRVSPEIRGSKSLKYKNESISISVIGAREVLSKHSRL